MRLTPLDIKKQEFSRGMRGYDVDEVQAFLSMLANQWEEMQAEQRRTEEKVRDLKAKMAHYERVEVALQEALQTARENSKQVLDNAKQEATLIVKKAVSEAEDLARSAVQQRNILANEIEGLLHRRNEMVARLRAFLNSEGEILARFEERAGMPVPPSIAPAVAVAEKVSLEETVSSEEEPVPEPEVSPQQVEAAPQQEEAEPEPVEEMAPLASAVPEDVSPVEVESLDLDEEEEVLDDVVAEEAIPTEVLDEKEEIPESETVSQPDVEAVTDAQVEETFIPKEEAQEQPALQINIPEDDLENGSFYRENEPLSFKFFEPNTEKPSSSFFEDGQEEMEPFGPDAPPIPKSDREPVSNETWIVRPTSESETTQTEGGLTASAEEIEKIRRILNDLD